MKHSLHTDRSAAALLLALWALFLLSAMVIAWALDIDSQIALSGNSSRALEAEAMACSGAEVALDPHVTSASTLLHKSLGKNQSYDARIVGEGGRLNLQWILSGEDQQRLAILQKYLENKGVDINERSLMVDALLDWVSPNTGIHHLNAPPESDDYHPPHTMLKSVDELRQVAGWQKFTAAKDWDADFTLYSSGPVDLAWASHDVLLSLPGFNEPIVDRFLAYRRGPDGIDGTADDPITSPDQLPLALGFTPVQYQQLQRLIGFNDPVVRVVSVGKSGDVTRTVEMIVRKSASPQIILWKEF
ncbi:MAG: hypothetical protein ACREIF_01555 [Chthoniobacterales bacterium]